MFDLALEKLNQAVLLKTASVLKSFDKKDTDGSNCLSKKKIRNNQNRFLCIFEQL
jgi:hypothetical protein